VATRYAWLALALVVSLGCGEETTDPSAAFAGAGGSPARAGGGTQSDGGAAARGDAGGAPDEDGGAAASGGTVSDGASGGTSSQSASGRGGTGHGAGRGGTAANTGGTAGDRSTRGGSGGTGAGGDPESAGQTSDAAGGASAGERGSAGETGDAGEVALALVPGESERKRVRNAAGRDIVLEEELVGFASPVWPRTRLRTLSSTLETSHEWSAPDNSYVTDFCLHPSGELTVVLIADTHVFSLVRLAPDLSVLGEAEVHDPAVATDPHADATGVTDLEGNGLVLDPAHVAAAGEDAFFVAVTTIDAVIGYRVSFADGAWSAPERTLIEPPVGLTPFLPIGGSYDTFGAIGAWFRAFVDFDASGDAFVATWADPLRIRAHASVFQDGLVPLPPDPDLPGAGDSDMLLTKLDPTGVRLWTRVIGSEHEDEPYALRVQGDAVAVVGRARRFPGFDNTAWDALVSVTSTAGDVSNTVVLTFDASSILLGVGARAGGGWLLAGSDGWVQNPDGLSILSNGNKLLVELPSLSEPPVRRPLTAGPRHNELHSVFATDGGVAFAGHEDGPLTHSGDGDATQIHATGVLGFLPDE